MELQGPAGSVRDRCTAEARLQFRRPVATPFIEQPVCERISRRLGGLELGNTSKRATLWRVYRWSRLQLRWHLLRSTQYSIVGQLEKRLEPFRLYERSLYSSRLPRAAAGC